MHTMFSTYQVQATSFATELPEFDRLSAHEINSGLHRRAEALAPRFAEETAEAGCTNLRPGADQPRRQQAWDLIAEAHAWNLIADDRYAVSAAKRAEAQGRKFQVAYAWNVASGERLSYQQPFVIDLGSRAEFLSYQEVRAIEDRVAQGTTLVYVDTQVATAVLVAQGQGWTFEGIEVDQVKVHVSQSQFFGFGATDPQGRRATVLVGTDGIATARVDITVPEAQVGDTLLTYGFLVAVEEVEVFDRGSHEPVTQARGQVTNYDQIRAQDEGLARYIDIESHGRRPAGEHWWTIQGNHLARVAREIRLPLAPAPLQVPVVSAAEWQPGQVPYTQPAASKICRHCGDALEVVEHRLVSVVSGDEGGTYDVCSLSPDGIHHPTPTSREVGR
jgi:hypothetical protein